MKEKKPRILIVSSDTGGGHRSAARAIADSLQKFWQSDTLAVKIIKGLEEAHKITAKLASIYNWLLRNKQQWVKYLYWTVNRIRPEKREFFYNLCYDYAKNLFDKWCPNIIVSVHPLTQHFFGRFLKELNLTDQIPLITIVTDPCYGFWKGWACEDVSLYLVANQHARQQLIDYGIHPDKVKISGMPIHPKFHEIDSQSVIKLRQSLGLEPNRFTVFVNAGWIGGGNIPKIFSELIREKLNIQTIFLAGKNQKLKEEAEKLTLKAKFPVKVFGYSDEMEKLMQVSNVMVSKLGGLTTFEALACRLPIIADVVTPPMPQEAGTTHLIVQKGAGILLRRTKDIVPVIKDLLDNPLKYNSMKTATTSLIVPNSTQKIAEEILSFLPERKKLVEAS